MLRMQEPFLRKGDRNLSTNKPLLTDRFDRALAYASKAHRTQVRKGTRVPYVSHLLGVASIALENGADEDQAIAALLHDAVEDQGGAVRLGDIRDNFGDRVARIVDDCTDTDIEPKPPWRERKEAYIESLANKANDSLEVSIADKTHNATAINADLRQIGDALWGRFSGGKEGSLWYYHSLAEAFSKLHPSSASARFSREVDEMQELAGM